MPGDAPSARWELPVTVRRGDDGLDFGGPFVRGARDDRHLGLAWGDVPGDARCELSAGELRLVDVEPGVIEAAMRPGHGSSPNPPDGRQRQPGLRRVHPRP